jgi:hypothetical protein
MAEIPPNLSAASMGRLTLVRFLYEGGVEQSRRPTPLSGLAILQLHDATEFFLQAAAEHKGVILDRNTDFMSYWPAMERAGINLGRQETMRRLNRAASCLSMTAHFRRIRTSMTLETRWVLSWRKISHLSLEYD